MGAFWLLKPTLGATVDAGSVKTEIGQRDEGAVLLDEAAVLRTFSSNIPHLVSPPVRFTLVRSGEDKTLDEQLYSQLLMRIDLNSATTDTYITFMRGQ